MEFFIWDFFLFFFYSWFLNAAIIERGEQEVKGVELQWDANHTYIQ